MDVTPPSLLRRLGIALAGLAVAALTGAACVLSFDDLRALAVHGGGRADLAYLYPAAFDALLVVTLICVLLLRSARALVRAQAAVVLVLLIVAAAAVNVATALSYPFPAAPTAVGVAVAPWVMLALALWLWLLLIKHVRAGRDYVRDDDGTREHDVIPFHREPETDRTAELPRPAAGQRQTEEPPPLEAASPAVPETTPVVGPTPAPETPEPERETARSASLAESGTAQAAAEPSPRNGAERSAAEPVADSASAERSTPPAADRTPSPGPDAEPATVPVARSSSPEPGAEEPAAEPDDVQPEQPEETAASSVPEPDHEPTRPVRWGDRVKPRDVLVHPRSDRTADTQPVPVVQDDGPDPRHGPEAADAGERDADLMEDTAPHPIVEEHDIPPSEAPSGRLRSTPRPPED